MSSLEVDSEINFVDIGTLGVEETTFYSIILLIWYEFVAESERLLLVSYIVNTGRKLGLQTRDGLVC